MANVVVLPTGNNTYNGTGGLGGADNADYVISQTPPSGGNNTITLGNGADQITLGAGNNTITLGNGLDRLVLGDGSNTVTTGNGNSQVIVGNGNDTITVGTGGNAIVLGTGLDTVSTAAGNNTVSVAGTAVSGDTIHGALSSGDGSSNRLVLTTPGTMSPVNVNGFQSYQLANGGPNSLTLSEGNFTNLPQGVLTVMGGNSGNTINAAALSAAHSVRVNGGFGIDLLTGGAGNDRFIFAASDLSGDTVSGGGGNNTLELASGSGVGKIDGLGGPSFSGFATVDVDAGASWLFTSTQAVTDTITLATGATAEFSGAVGSGHTIAFATSTGTLKIDSAGQFAGKIVGFQTGDSIDLATEAFDSNGSVVLRAGNVLQVTENGHIDNLTFDPNQIVSGAQFHISSDGAGGTNISFTSAPPNVAPPSGTTADMVLHRADGNYAIYNIGNNAILAAGYLGQVGADNQFSGLGNFDNVTTNGMMLRSATSGNFEAYDISGNNIVGAAALGAVGSNWQVAGFGNFNGPNTTTDMMLRDSNTGTFELYNINHNAVTGASALGAVGLDWQVQGFGDFNGDGTTDMMLRNASTGTFEDYDIKNGQLVGAHALGAVGNDWQYVGQADFNGDGTTDMMLRNTTTGTFDIYNISNDAVTSASSIGAVGLDWQVTGFGPFNGAGSVDMMLHNANSGAFEIYDISHNNVTGTAALGAVGLEWQVGGVAVHLPAST